MKRLSNIYKQVFNTHSSPRYTARSEKILKEIVAPVPQAFKTVFTLFHVRTAHSRPRSSLALGTIQKQCMPRRKR